MYFKLSRNKCWTTRWGMVGEERRPTRMFAIKMITSTLASYPSAGVSSLHTASHTNLIFQVNLYPPVCSSVSQQIDRQSSQPVNQSVMYTPSINFQPTVCQSVSPPTPLPLSCSLNQEVVIEASCVDGLARVTEDGCCWKSMPGTEWPGRWVYGSGLEKHVRCLILTIGHGDSHAGSASIISPRFSLIIAASWWWCRWWRRRRCRCGSWQRRGCRSWPLTSVGCRCCSWRGGGCPSSWHRACCLCCWRCCPRANCSGGWRCCRSGRGWYLPLSGCWCCRVVVPGATGYVWTAAPKMVTLVSGTLQTQIMAVVNAVRLTTNHCWPQLLGKVVLLTKFVSAWDKQNRHYSDNIPLTLWNNNSHSFQNQMKNRSLVHWLTAVITLYLFECFSGQLQGILQGIGSQWIIKGRQSYLDFKPPLRVSDEVVAFDSFQIFTSGSPAHVLRPYVISSHPVLQAHPAVEAPHAVRITCTQEAQCQSKCIGLASNCGSLGKNP